MLHLYGERVLAFDTTPCWIKRADEATRRGVDIIIAATAQHHGSTILSRNVRHFVQPDVPALDPLAALS